jgi:hypothetical protein
MSLTGLETMRGIAMDFIFMLTRADRTVDDCLEVLDAIEPLALAHIGFKDVGVEPAVLATLNRRIRARAALSYMEIVSTDADACLDAVRLALDIGVDRILGGSGDTIDAVLKLLSGSGIAYLPFAGSPFDHPTRLGGTPEQITAHCRDFIAKGCFGSDLLAYRATQAEPLALVRAARQGLGAGYLVVAGSVDSPGKVARLAAAGADAFTIGSAVFDGSFAPRQGTLQAQLRAVQTACCSL